MFKVYEQGLVFSKVEPDSIYYDVWGPEYQCTDVSYDLRFKCRDERRTLEVAKELAKAVRPSLKTRHKGADLLIEVEELDCVDSRDYSRRAGAVHIRKNGAPIHSFFIEETFEGNDNEG